MQRMACIGALASLIGISNAAIAENGIWTNQNWYDSANKIGVANGVPYSNDASASHRLSAPLTVDGDISQDYLTRANVQRIMTIFDEIKWDQGFPLANDIYTYDNFL